MTIAAYIGAGFVYLVIGAISGIMANRADQQRESSFDMPGLLMALSFLLTPFFAAWLVAWLILGKMKVEIIKDE